MKQHKKEERIIATETQTTNSVWNKLTTGFMPYAMIAILGLILYANTFHHEFALDDELIICENSYVLRGVDGLGDIFKSDIFDSYYKSIHAEANMSGGRYRPFSLATFAIEQQFIGTLSDGIKDDSWDINKNNIGDANEDINHDGVFNVKDTKTKGMAFRHINNVLLYILSVCILYLFLSRFFFKENKLLALLTALLFLVHPIHTEVVANVKSRDEILSLMFMVLTLHFSFLYTEAKKMKHLLWALICFFIALLSKEYGVTLLLIIPASLYVYDQHFKFSNVRPLLLGLLITFGIYFAIRSSIVISLADNAVQDNELLNNPFMSATAEQAMATKLFIHLKYFILLLTPYSLSSDYSYNAIAFRTFANPEVWLSIVLLTGFVIAIIVAYRKRNWLLIPLLFMSLPILLINNFFFNIGATMGERFVYHSSLGMCILLVYGLYYIMTVVVKTKPQYVVLALLPVFILYSIKTIARNPAWKNNVILYLTDVKTYPNSMMLNSNASVSLFDLSAMPANESRKKGLLDSSNMYGLKALQLNPRNYTTYLNLGLVKATQGDMDSATYHWLKAKELSPNEQRLPGLLQISASYYYNKGVDFYTVQKYDEALVFLNIANKLGPRDPTPYYYLGMVYNGQKKFSQAKEIWSKGLSFAPNDSSLQMVLKEIKN